MPTFRDKDMKQTKVHYIFTAFMLPALLSGCATPPTDTDNAHMTAGPLAVLQPTPISDLVPQILATARNRNGPITLDVRYCVRDCRVGENPATEYFQKPNATAIADWGYSSIQCASALPIEAALELALAPNLDFHMNPFASPKPCISIGPSELVEDHPAIVRRTYKVPRNRAKMLSKLPSRLSATGISMAYDPQSGLLTVIDDEQHSTAGALLDAVGARPVLQNPQIPEI